jgi:hypothetical protein
MRIARIVTRYRKTLIGGTVLAGLVRTGDRHLDRDIMTRIAIWTVALWASIAAVAHADGPVVVELFTSQGCSSCPPADRILGEIAQRDDVIALGLHVDYWDYIGWKDKFANPAFTKRQRAYARAAGERSVYTPQMIVGGKDHLIGTKPMQLADLLQAHAAIPKPVEVSLSRGGGRVTIVAKSRNGAVQGALVQLVTYTPRASVAIGRGENAGKTLEYHNIVREWVDVGTWDGRTDFRATVRVPDNTPVAVLVQSRGTGPILGAARLR